MFKKLWLKLFPAPEFYWFKCFTCNVPRRQLHPPKLVRFHATSIGWSNEPTCDRCISDVKNEA